MIPVRGGTTGEPPAALPQFLKQPFAQIAYLGDNVVFTTEVLVNAGPLIYSWTHNGQPIGTDSPRLEMMSVRSAQAGTYVVTVTGDYWSHYHHPWHRRQRMGTGRIHSESARRQW